ncbi:MAG: HAD-IIA family hydrolase [Anaerolineaceae bacterium]|nr:HAD-IIA family hydrolase [Anaerolineaceae bacterium]
MIAPKDIDALILDMDGVLWRGEEALPGLAEFFTAARARGLPCALATNNSARAPASYVGKLAKMGVADFPSTHILTSGTVTLAHLREHFPAATALHVLGGDGLREILSAAGFRLVEREAAAVVVGLDRHVSYRKLTNAMRCLQEGAAFIATNQDSSYPTPEGLAPGAGSLVAALAYASGRPPTNIGKPAAPLFQAALAVLGTRAARTLMIGDRLETDILGAADIGMPTALVMTGVTSTDRLRESSLQPDFVYAGLPELADALFSRNSVST